MEYRFKAAQEIAWAALIAAALQLLQVLVIYDPEKIADYRTWLVSIAGALIRAAAGGAIAAYGAKKATG